MENMELKEEMAGQKSIGEKPRKKGQELNVQAAPFEPKMGIPDQELIVSKFELLSTKSSDHSSPKSPDFDNYQSTINDLVKQLNASRAEVDKLKETI